MYKIALSNGSVLDNLELNGNNYISDTILDDAVFSGGLDTVVISGGETTETITNAKLLSNRVDGGKSWFVLGQKTPQELAMERLASSISRDQNDITDVQTAMAELYELMMGGK